MIFNPVEKLTFKKHSTVFSKKLLKAFDSK